MASNASLTDCFVMTGVSFAIAWSGEIVTTAAVDAVVAMVAAMDRSKKPLRVVLAANNSDVDDAAMETLSPLLHRTPPPIRVDARPKRRHRGATDTKPLVNTDARKMSIADGSNNALKSSIAEYLTVRR